MILITMMIGEIEAICDSIKADNVDFDLYSILIDDEEINGDEGWILI